MSTYSVVTAARNEAANLTRLADCLLTQNVLPAAWIIVDDDSTDDTAAVAQGLQARAETIHVVSLTAARTETRGAPVARAFQAGLQALRAPTDVVVKLDADVSFESNYFAVLLDAFAADASLGMASGSCYERQADGRWEQQQVTAASVWGATRAYRWACLQDVLPLEEFMGWDGIDQIKANVHGWTTTTLKALPFRHHRREGDRDGSRKRAWEAQGHAAYYVGYRWWYLLFRALHRARSEPAALAMLTTYSEDALRRAPRCADPAVRSHLRRSQSLSRLPARMREATGR
jgi:glycosyltransferase involved in cell wall biosynthesis